MAQKRDALLFSKVKRKNQGTQVNFYFKNLTSKPVQTDDMKGGSTLSLGF